MYVFDQGFSQLKENVFEFKLIKSNQYNFMIVCIRWFCAGTE